MLYKKIRKTSCSIFLSLLLSVSLVGILPAAADNQTNPSSPPADAAAKASDFCANYGATQSACTHGYNAGNNNQTENAACQAYTGDKLSACTAGWGDATHTDPAITCVKDQCDLVAKYINPTIAVASICFGLIAVISIIGGAIQYSASEGDPQRASAAKGRITNTIIAIFAYLFLYAFLQFLIPGGAFH